MKTTRKKTQVELELENIRDGVRTKARYQGRVLARAIINEELPAAEALFIEDIQRGVLPPAPEAKEILG